VGAWIETFSKLAQELHRQSREKLFDILHLLAHLLDQYFKFYRYPGHFLVGRFGSQGIGFAIQFLH